MDSLISNSTAARRALWEYLRGLSRNARVGGESLYASGRVRDLQRGADPDSFIADVIDGQKCEVELVYDAYGWDASCTCDEVGRCRHAYATGLAIVGTLTSAPPLAALAALPKEKVAQSSEPTLESIVKHALGRTLNQNELTLIRKIRSIAQMCRNGMYVGAWELQDLVPYDRISYGQHVELWPKPPGTELEAWLYLAHYLQSVHAPIPPFLQPITDFSRIEPELGNWLHGKRIREWKQALAKRPTLLASRAVAGETDLRLVIGPDKAQLEARLPGEQQFRKVRREETTQWRQERSSLNFTGPAHLLWTLFPEEFSSSSIRYEDHSKLESLECILRASLLISRVVDPQGEPLKRPTEPLRWHLGEPRNGERDYTLQLVQADGSPLGSVLSVFNGSPSLFLTNGVVLSGPPLFDGALKYDQVNAIPVDVIESADGVGFLRSLGIALPEKLREQVKVLDYQPAIQCSLRARGTWKPDEECQFKITATARDGRRLSRGSTGWQEVRGPRKRKTESWLAIYDDERLAQVDGLLQPLNLKNSYYDGQPCMKVNKKFAETFVEWHRSLPPWLKVELDGELATLVQGEVSGRVKLEVQEAEIDWFDLSVVLDVSDTTLTPAEIKLLLAAKGSFVRLEGKGWRKLKFDLTQEDDEQLARLGLSPRELSAEPQRLHALQLADRGARKLLPEQQVAQIERRAEEIKARVTPELPTGVTAQLRPYQLEGFHFLAYLSENRFGGILADDMGLGKTLQTLAWLLWLRKTPAPQPQGTGPEPSLVVCPKSVMDNWQAEAGRFTPGLKVKVWSAGKLEGFSNELATADLHVINYAQLRGLETDIASVHWLAAILDEGQYIKNPNSQTAQVARSLRASHRLILSGTPIENKLLDLWSLMGFAMPGVLGNRSQFLRIYDAQEDPLARKRLSSRVRPFLLRRTKGQVATDLPDKIEEELFCEMEGEQLMLYRAELKRAQQLLLSVQTQKELAEQQFHFLTSLLRLRQICCDPRLVAPNSRGSSAKTEALFEQLEPLIEEGHKVLVFSQFVEVLDLLKKAIEPRQWPYFYLSGATENRGELVRSFQEKEGAAIFLISLKAGGFGLNLTAASYVVLFDPWWNPAVENQAIDRTHRIGQTNKVMAYRLLIKNSIEEKIRVLQKQKKALAEDVLGEERFAQSLTLDDLRFLFADT